MADAPTTQSRTGWLALCLVGSVPLAFGLLFGFSTAIIAGVLDDVVAVYDLSTGATEEVVAVLVFSAFVGALVASPISRRFGRRTALLLAAALAMLGYAIILLEPERTTFIFARIVVGLAVGLSSMVAPMYAGEATPARYRGAVVSIFQLAVTLGILAAYATPLFLGMYFGWFQLIGIGVAIGGFGALSALAVPESPRWLVSRGHMERARSTASFLGLPDPTHAQSVGNGRRPPVRTAMVGAVPFVLALCGGLFILQNLSGIDAILYYAPRIFEDLGFEKGEAALSATFILGAVNVVATVVAIAVMDRLGRRPLVIVGSALMAAGLLGVVSAQVWGSVILGLVGLCLYIAAFAISLGPLPYVMMAELFPSTIREPGIAAASATSWLFNAAVAFYFLSAIEWLGSVTVFVFFTVVCAISLGVGWLFMPETKGVTLEEIEVNVLKGMRLRHLGRS